MWNLIYKALANIAKPLLKLFLGFKVEKIGLQGLKPPFVVLSSHSTRLDFILTGCALYPYKLNFLGASHNFAIKGTRKLVEKVGVISKEKSSGDLVAMRKLKRAIDEGNAVIVFPSGMSTHIGVNYPIPTNTAKLVKFLNVPVVTAQIEGGFWALPPFLSGINKGRIKVTIKKLFTQEQLKQLPNDEIYKSIVKEISFDDIEYQKQRPVKLPAKRLGTLDRILYECSNCHHRYTMIPNAKGNTLVCADCGNTIYFDEFGTLIYKDKVSNMPNNIRDYCKMEIDNLKDDSGNFDIQLDVSRKVTDMATANSAMLAAGKLTINSEGMRFVNEDEDILYLAPPELVNISQFNLKQLYIAKDGVEIMFEPSEKNKILSALWYCKFCERNKG